MRLLITRPVVFFDLETTGTNTNEDKIVQIAIKKLMTDGSIKETKTLINPEIPIPKEATDVHGITDEMVKNAPTFKSVAPKLITFMSDCDLAGYNSNSFDIPLLSSEFEREKIDFPSPDQKRLDVYLNECRLVSRKLTDVYKRYFDKELEDAHDAMADVTATLEVLLKQIEIEGVDMTIDDLLALIGSSDSFDWAGWIVYNENEIPVWTRGKNKNKPIEDDAGYINWFLGCADMPKQTKKCIREFLDRKVLEFQRLKSEKELEDQETK